MLIEKRVRPQAPNLQIYRPQLTSVLSIANRVSGIVTTLGAIGLVLWLLATAAGPASHAIARDLLASPPGQVGVFGFAFAFFLHSTGGLRHLVWDTARCLELSEIYLSGWIVVAASVLLTLVTWLVTGPT